MKTKANTLLIKNTFILLMLFSTILKISAQAKTIHVFVALCDNKYQGIVPVPETLGNGKDYKNNLYWGAAYGVKSFLKFKTKDWVFIKNLESNNTNILNRVLFKHRTKAIYLLADAYNGKYIKKCTEDFLKASNTQNALKIELNKEELCFGGDAQMLAYIGHNGLMDFDINVTYKPVQSQKKDVIILACFSQSYFSNEIKKAQANPILWSTHLMAPEAYTLKAAIDGWINNESGIQIEERAAQAYNKYQKCGIRGARNLLTTGYKK